MAVKHVLGSIRRSRRPKYPRGKKAVGKIRKTMGEFGKGELHSGSKKGPLVKSRKQAVAIALSQARKAE